MKTVFAHGTPITPEWLNAITNPVFKEAPENDGDLPLPLISTQQLTDLSFLNGTTLEAFFSGLGYNPADPASNGPITGAQIIEALNAIHASNTERVVILQKLASSLYFPPARLPVFYQARYTGYSRELAIKTPLLGHNFMVPTNNLLFMQTGGYESRCGTLQGYIDIYNAVSSKTYANPAPATPNGTGLLGVLPFIDVNPYISLLSVFLYQNDVASTRVFNMALRVLETRDFDWSIPVQFSVDQAIELSQFDEIGFQVCDANGGIYYRLELPDLFNKRSLDYMLRIQRINGVLRSGWAWL